MRLALLLLGVLYCCHVSHSTHHAHGPRWRDLGRSSATTCPGIPAGLGKKVQLVHRLSPCSPLASAGARKPSLHETLHRDGLRLRYLSKIQVAATASGGDLSQTVISSLPGVYDYTVITNYGEPPQALPLYLDFTGMSNIRCEPCFSGGGLVAMAFDPSRSFTFRSLTCGSPKCTVEQQCSPATAPPRLHAPPQLDLRGRQRHGGDGHARVRGAGRQLRVPGLRGRMHAAGAATRWRPACWAAAPPPSPTAGLPADTDVHGFLAISPTLSDPDYSAAAGVKYVPLVSNPSGRGPNFYYVDLVAIAVDGEDLAFPPAEFRANGTMIDSQAAFTYLNPPIYAALRDEFRAAMARRRYPPAPAFGGLDTCYNFTGVVEKEEMKIYLPDITLRFGNGEAMDLDDTQFMYFFRDHLDDAFAFGCLAFGAAAEENFLGNLLGSQVQRTREIVFDVLGGKVAFVPSRCGVR